MDESAEIESRVRAALDAAGIPYDTIACTPDQADTAVFCEVFDIAPEDSVNTILVAGKVEPRAYSACLVRADTRLDVNRAVRKEMGVRRASFAGLDEAVEVTGMMYGGVTPFGLPDEIPILIDARIAGDGVVWLGGGSRSLKVGVKADDLLRLSNSRLVEDLAK